MIKYYLEPLKSVLTEIELNSIFSIIDLIADFHTAMLKQLEKLLCSGYVAIGSFLVEKVSFFHSYSAYINNYTMAITCLGACQDRAEVSERMAELSAAVTAEGEPLQSLYSYLVMPIQRLPTYLVLLGQLKSCTPLVDPDYAALQKTIDVLTDILEYINEKRHSYEAKLRMLGLSVAIHHTPPDIAVMQPDRTFHAEGDFLLVNGDEEKPVTVFLFSNAVFVTEVLKSRSRIRFKTPATPVRRASSSSDQLRSMPQQVTPRPLDRLFGYLSSLDLKEPKSVTVQRFTDGTFSIGVADRQVLLRLLPETKEQEQLHAFGFNTPTTKTTTTTSVLDSLCALLGIPLPEPQVRELARTSSSLFRRRRTSIFGPLRPSSPYKKLSFDSLTDCAVDSRSRKLRTRSGSSETVELNSRTFLCEAPDTDQEGQLAFNPLEHQTLVQAGFIPERAASFSHVLPCWGEVEADENSRDFVSFVPGYHIELGNRRLRSELIVPPNLMYSDYEVAFYERSLVPVEHLNFFSSDSDSAGRAPVIISAEIEPPATLLSHRRVVIRSRYGERRTLVPAARGPPTGRGFFKYLEQSNPDLLTKGTTWLARPPTVEAQRASSPRSFERSLADMLCEYDARQRRMLTKLKVGVVNTLPGDMTSRSDRSIYDHQTISPDFHEFLEFLGQRVQLRGYTGFSGGLDTTSDLTGTHSVMATFAAASEIIEIMFHVSALLPHREHDDQQLAKKRHVGNDIVVVVFHEDTEPFDPSVFRSKMNQVFLVVKKVGMRDHLPRYQLAYFCKEQAPSLPLLPNIPDFVADENFRRFLLAKLINAEATTQHTSPIFTKRNSRARASALLELGGLFW